MDSHILRIKRKATEPPLTSLVIQESSERAKKRAKQHTDSIAANNDGAGVFRLAQTVGKEWEGVGQEAEVFRQRIQRLMAETAQEGTSEPPTDTSPMSDVQHNIPDSNPSSTEESIASQRVFRVYKSLGKKAVAGRAARAASARARGRANGFFGDRIESVVPQSSSDFRIIDARPEPSRPAQPQTGRTATPQQPDHAGMDMDDEDMKEIAKFLPMLQGATPAAKPKPEPIPLAPPAVYAPTGAITPLQRSVVTQASSVASTPSRNSVVADDDDGDYVYDLYYRDPAVRVADISGKESGMGGSAIGALQGLDELLDEENDPGSDTEEGDEADEDSNDEDFYRNEYPEDEDASSGDERFPDDAHRNYRYGDELDPDRDGFDDGDADSEDDTPTANANDAPPSIRARQLDRMMRNLGLNRDDLSQRPITGGYPSSGGGLRDVRDGLGSGDDADEDEDFDEEEDIRQWKLLHDD
ncbi:hypothetical protein QFC21_003755 [Naganishia friedmannii]|uniref:Uncharacterized protein n=1 Tax=Naganishia friedmannii TaxID=89922 RepID=A0ACC2VKE1_9TREE|nr:hypothetical protein QFC21_003755 [Naganishia friedmannii]